MKVKRITWKNDSPATEKQVEYVTDLVTKMKTSRSAGVLTDPGDRMMWELWESAKVPADLTKTEASALIDLLKYAYWDSMSLAMDIASALLKRIEGSGVNSSKDKAICMLALTNCKSILDAIEPEKMSAAKELHAQRQEA